ncbi:up-regulator of cell proliferation-like [Discoglossus pictus]
MDEDKHEIIPNVQIGGEEFKTVTNVQINGEAYENISYWKNTLIDICQEDEDGLLDELDIILNLSSEDHIQLYEIASPKDRIDKMINIILQKGETVCQTFLDHLENMVPRFPTLVNLPIKKQQLFTELMKKMNMYRTSMFTLKNILDIGRENVEEIDPQTAEDLPSYFLRKLMALKMTARKTQLKESADILESSEAKPTQDIYEDFESDDDDDSGGGASSSFHPLDVLCALLHGSDMFLQQEVVSKMSMCQFAVPLLLPAGDGQKCTLMLWAIREIVKRWRPQSLADTKGFSEDNLVHISMPTFSFVRLGKSKLSKSKILNTIISPAQQNHDFFIHENMECGNVQRKISDGLVEISWYFPAGRENLETFSEPIAVTNLRGDLESNWTQFSFLTQVSSAVFIFVESLSEREFQLLSNCNLDAKYYFIISPSIGKHVNKETLKILKQLFPVLKIDTRNVLRKDKIANDAELKNNIQKMITNVMKNSCKSLKLEDMSDIACELGIEVDESSEECQKARTCAMEITNEISDVVRYKKETLKLQGDLWRQLSQIEKELCRMRKQEDKNGEEYKDELRQRQLDLHKKQHQHDLPSGMIKFISAITHLSQVEKHYFLKWIKSILDTIARNKMAALKAEYKDKCKKALNDQDELRKLDQEKSDSSLGVEHFLRELGQFYEAECSMVKERQLNEKQRQFTKLPGIAADLLLDGFPLELIDGDASNIPLQWITDVLTDVDNKTGRRSKIRVITVLGVQSTGKSTLLNTMFGLQFPVASGRCTRGAFMTLIKVKENFQEELGCDFILVIDTEGLKAPELASLEHSYEHDNELATLVIGLSDITIINMAMENTEEMKDILQIVVHAFLRMKEIGKKPNCQFVHQNVSDVSAHDNNMMGRKKLLEQLNEMTKIAATMEKKSGITSFCHVMDYDFEKHNWYIPGLWQGVPPMATINSGYSENVFELKKYLFDVVKTSKSSQKPQNIHEFIEWIKSLWNAVKHEKFIFSFRNSLVAEAYNHLSVQFSKWEWAFCKEVHNWLTKTETNIKNQSADNLQMETCQMFKDDLSMILLQEGNKISDLLENYFENGSENVHLIERYKTDFVLSAKSLKQELERNAHSKIDEAVRIQKGKHEIQCMQNKSVEQMEKEVTKLLENCRKKKCKLDDSQIKNKFENMWKKTLSGLNLGTLKRRNISQTMLQLLRNDMSNKGSEINEKLMSLRSLDGYTCDLQMNKKYIDINWFERVYNTVFRISTCYDKLKELASSLIERANGYVTEKTTAKEDYDELYGQHLLHMINDRLGSEDVKKIHFSSLFELDIKLLIFARAAVLFQKMHDTFIQANDPKLCLDKLKPQYFSTFQNIFQEKDECQTRAKSFCECCLKPAILEYIYKHLGQEIVGDVLNSCGSSTFCSRTFFQFTVLEELLNQMDCKEYVKYIYSYEKFVKNWIVQYISKKYEKCTGLESLKKDILSNIIKKIKNDLQNKKVLNQPSVSDFLKVLCEKLKNELVISQTAMQAILFHNKANVSKFSEDILLFLTETEKDIMSERKSLRIDIVLSKVTLKPQDTLFKKVFGCGNQCPFCKAPCEAGGDGHEKHTASVHRPQGLGRYRFENSEKLVVSICSTDVVSTDRFRNSDTDWVYINYKDYQTIYPDWLIQADPSIQSSDYWKFVFTQFNEQFAEEYNAKPADLPEGWKRITAEDALSSLKETFCMK